VVIRCAPATEAVLVLCTIVGSHQRLMGPAQALADAKARGLWRDVVEWVPAYTSLTLHFGVAGLGDAAQAAADALLALARHSTPLSRPGRRWRFQCGKQRSGMAAFG
jgi:allophanate hydrolase subunit 1